MTTRPFCGIVLSALLAVAAFAGPAQTAGAPAAKETKPQPDASFVYATTAKRELRLYTFYPPGWSAKDRRAAIVFFFGGGWVSGSPQQFFGQASRIASLGMVAMSADYEVKNTDGTYPAAAVGDGKAAIRWVRQHASELGIDPDRIAASGGSSGGGLALDTALAPGLERPDQDLTVSPAANLFVLFNPGVDTSRPLSRPLWNNPAAQQAGSATEHVHAGVPAAIIFHGTKDDFSIDYEDRFCAKMHAVGNECEVVPYAGMHHGFFNKGPAYEDTLRRSIDFLRRHGYLGMEACNAATPAVASTERKQ